MKIITIFLISCSVLLVFTPSETFAHATAGKRVFPATLVVDDPGVNDEFNILYNYVQEPDHITESIETSWTKTITPDLGIEFAQSYSIFKPYGFDNLSVNLKYQLYIDKKEEKIISVGFETDIGGTGNRHFADSFSTFTPSIYIGKGLNSFPDCLKYLRPIAVTGVLGVSFPTENVNVKTLNIGFTFQYNLRYLQSYVKDIGIEDPYKELIPVIEFPLTVDLNGEDKGAFTGYVCPGIIWMKKWFQMGLEAQIPINRETGTHIGVLFQIHFYLDDLFPKGIGKPLFKKKENI